MSVTSNIVKIAQVDMEYLLQRFSSQLSLDFWLCKGIDMLLLKLNNRKFTGD